MVGKNDRVPLFDLSVERALKEAVEIDPEFLQEEFVRLPADIAYWNERYSLALREFLEAKNERERMAGELWNDPSLASSLEIQLEKKPTVDQLKGAVLNDARYIAGRDRETAADVERTRLRGCVDALAAKRDMIISLGAHIRLELVSDPVLRKRAAEARGLRSDAANGREDADY